jgi:predicted enzyme related to lactoylglutathione lyase
VALRLYTVVIDAQDPHSLGQFWADVLGWRVLTDDEDGVIVGADEQAYPGLCLLRVPETKTIKNRLHIDLSPDDRDAEVDRLLGLGASRVDIGQAADVTWVVLADPEGNEFCVLRPQPSLVE